jgi:hypothetical protein
MLKQTLRLWQYKHFDSPHLILRVNPHTKANTSTRSVCLLMLEYLIRSLSLYYISNPFSYTYQNYRTNAVIPTALYYATSCYPMPSYGLLLSPNYLLTRILSLYLRFPSCHFVAPHACVGHPTYNPNSPIGHSLPTNAKHHCPPLAG